MMRNVKCFIGVYVITAVVWVQSLDMPKEELDKVIEDEITMKLSSDLVQSIERKFQVDLEKSVDMVLVKIKMLLQNGTSHIQDKLVELQDMLDIIKNEGEKELNSCLEDRQNETAALAEKALHQMVVCGYALIGHDPAQAVTKVTGLKEMISKSIKPIYAEKKEIYDLLKVCGHDHETLKKVIKCVISKYLCISRYHTRFEDRVVETHWDNIDDLCESTTIKSVMMEITSKLIEGVVDLTKLMAHGAMHEACLIEVLKTTEDEAFTLVKKVRHCARGNTTADEEVVRFIKENNATVVDIDKREQKNKTNALEVEDSTDVKTMIRRMLSQNKPQDFDKKFKEKLSKMQEDINIVNNNLIDGSKKGD